MENIIRTFAQATPDQLKTGKAWYKTARDWCSWCAGEFKIEPRTVACMVAVLSPRNRWEWNLQDVVKLLSAIRDGQDARQVGCHGFNKNRDKAIDIALGQPYEIKSKKVGAFVDNLIHENSTRVTVDVWAYRIYLGDYKLPIVPIQPKLYDRIESEYIAVAGLYDLRPYELQAITWAVARDTGPKFNEIVPNTI